MNEITEEILMDSEYELEEEFEEEFADKIPSEEESEFADVAKELRFQLKFNECSRKYIKVKYNGQKIKVIPIAEFKKTSKFVLKTDDGKILQVKKSELSR